MSATPITNPLELRGQGAIDLDPAAVSADDDRFWSVTEILRAVGDSNGLIHWAAKEAAGAAVTSRETWQAMEREQGTDEALDWIASARFRPPKGKISDSAFGTRVHELLEQYALTGARPEVVATPTLPEADVDNARRCLDQFDRWLQDFQPTYLATEAIVYSETYGYAGTADAMLELGGVRFLGDYKSSRKSHDTKGKPTRPYAYSVGLQVAAYAKAEILATWRARRFEETRKRYYLLNADERALAVPVPEVDAGLAIHVTPEHCDAYPIPRLEAAFEAFLHALECARWVFQDSKRAMGPALIRPTTNDTRS